MRRSFILFLILSSWLTSVVYAEINLDQHTDKVIKNSAPVWVINNTINPALPPPKNGSSGGIWYLCAEQQVHIEKETDFGHYAYRFLNPAGLDEKAQLSFNFDPAHQTLNLHSLIIHRDGKLLDRLAESEIRLVQREDGHEQQLYDGSLTAIIILKDIRVGDVLDYSYSIVGKNPVFGGHYCTFQTLGFSMPVNLLYKRFIWDPNIRTLHHKLFCTEKKATITKLGNADELNQLIWGKNDSEPVTRDSSTPAWHISSPMIQISDYDSWQDFGTWATPIYQIKPILPQSLKKVCDEIKQLPNDSQRIMAALKHVQDNIRYLGSFMGKHSHQPYPIETICERRFGDCKDKSIMLASMLQYLGYDAVPALVETDDRETISQYLPSHFDFDHVIVCLRHDGETYWIDGTRSYQGGNIQNIFIPNYAQAFVIDGKSTALTKIKPRGHHTKATVINEHFEFPDLSGKADLTVSTTVTGADADYWRYRIATNTKEELTKEFLEFHSAVYPEITSSAPIVFSDDPSTNRIVITRSYSITDFWEADEDDSDSMTGLIEAKSSYNKIDYPSSPLRTMPYRISHPVNLTHTIRIDLPIDCNPSEISEKINNDSFKFTVTSDISDRSVVLRYRYQSKSDFAAFKTLKNYLAECDRADDSTYYWIYCNKAILETGSGQTRGPLSNILILSIACGSGLGLLLAIILYYYDPKPRNMVEPKMYCGLQGWLVLVAIGICLDPLLCLSTFDDTSEFFNGSTLKDLLDSGYGDNIISWFISLSCTAFLIPFSILLTVLFFSKRSSFPHVYIAYHITSFLLEVIVYKINVEVEDMEQASLAETKNGLIVMGILLAIWIPYMLISKRVRNTFRTTRRIDIEPPIPTLTPSPPVFPKLAVSPPLETAFTPASLGGPPTLTPPPSEPTTGPD